MRSRYCARRGRLAIGAEGEEALEWADEMPTGHVLEFPSPAEVPEDVAAALLLDHRIGRSWRTAEPG